MPDHVFDRWTRRRFGQVAGALITAPVLGGAASPADAKHHHGKKHKNKNKNKHNFNNNPENCIFTQCQGLGESCNPFGSPCCNCWECGQVGEGPNIPFVCLG